MSIASVDDLPTYQGWPNVPAHLHTKTSWAREGFQPLNLEQPAAYCQTRSGRYGLYALEDCQPKPSPRRGHNRKDWPATFSEYHQVPRNWGEYVAALSGVGPHAPLSGVLKDACAYLWSLNRYTKHDACSSRQRADIYDLKTRIVRCLFLAGFCVNAYQSASPIHDADCYACHGSGWQIDDYEDWKEPCWKCDGSGIFRSGGRPYWTLVFEVPAGAIKQYRWHQPAHLASWAQPVGRPPAAGAEQVTVEKNRDIGLAKRRLPEALAYLRWMAENLERLYPVPVPPQAPLIPLTVATPLWSRLMQSSSPGVMHEYGDVPF